MGATEPNGNGGQAGLYTFKKLEVWQQARSLAVDVYKIARRLPKDDATRVITRQFVAAATSIRENIAEGHGRYSRAAYRNHLSIARGSAAETKDWVEMLRSIDLLSEAEERELTARCQRVIASLTRSMQRLNTSLAAKNPGRLAEPSVFYGADDEERFIRHPQETDEDALMPTSSLAFDEDHND